MPGSQKIVFAGAHGVDLAARLELPDGTIRAFAIFAHCFTCSKDILAAKRIATRLAEEGIAVLRFDFTGLGSSEGEFANTNFSSNVQDLLKAALFLSENYEPPKILIGHSLGGAAVLTAAADLPDVKAVVSIGAPADAAHVVHNFGASLDEIKAKGEAVVKLAGRDFTIKKQFLDDLDKTDVKARLVSMKKALMVMHSPIDATVGIENASQIFAAAKHPKSFVSLDDSDHLLSTEADASYAATIISAWVSRFVGKKQQTTESKSDVARITETLQGKFQNAIDVAGYHFLADEPVSVGGLSSGPNPYDFLAASLGACTTMTLRMYAKFKKIELGRISVEVSHSKVHAKDCEDCAAEIRSEGGRIDRFERTIHVEQLSDPALQEKILEIADKCPVHRTLEKGAVVFTELSAETN